MSKKNVVPKVFFDIWYQWIFFFILFDFSLFKIQFYNFGIISWNLKHSRWKWKNESATLYFNLYPYFIGPISKISNWEIHFENFMFWKIHFLVCIPFQLLHLYSIKVRFDPKLVQLWPTFNQIAPNSNIQKSQILNQITTRNFWIIASSVQILNSKQILIKALQAQKNSIVLLLHTFAKRHEDEKKSVFVGCLAGAWVEEIFFFVVTCCKVFSAKRALF